MRKKRYIILGLFVICIVVITIYMKKPNNSEFVKWFKESYNVRCEDADCYVINIGNQYEKTKDNRFYFAEGYYDNSIGLFAMAMQTKRVYRKVGESNQFFIIEVKGFFGNFKVLELRPNKVDISQLEYDFRNN
ncbi:hypothetical protein [Cytobacillus sp. IB215316]|uniref:hypothetical protein n=1 Tax=Cytobacillus sp. IB215316 TaxID=3097354 RepID=UPI002A15414B|nr:hypothetical protein [Cytobacillus sp. IB215316]MDX8363391.1 hypothetical protein [Cytobacillus sp. IB215316]